MLNQESEPRVSMRCRCSFSLSVTQPPVCNRKAPVRLCVTRSVVGINTNKSVRGYLRYLDRDSVCIEKVQRPVLKMIEVWKDGDCLETKRRCHRGT